MLFIITAVILAMVADRVSRRGSGCSAAIAASQAKELEVQRGARAAAGHHRQHSRRRLGSVGRARFGAAAHRLRQRLRRRHMVGLLAERVDVDAELLAADRAARRSRAAAAGSRPRRFASGDEGENEFRWITKDGRIRWVLARSIVIKDDAGRPIGMRGVTFDITDRKEAERRLALLAEISTTGLIHPSPLAEVAALHRATHRRSDRRLLHHPHGQRRQLERRRLRARLADAEGDLGALTDVPDLAAVNARTASSLRQPADDRRRRSADRHAAPRSKTRFDAPDGRDGFASRRGVLCPLVSQRPRVRHAGDRARDRRALLPTTRCAVGRSDCRARGAAARERPARSRRRSAKPTRRGRRAPRPKKPGASRTSSSPRCRTSCARRSTRSSAGRTCCAIRSCRRSGGSAAIDTIVRNAQSQEQLIADILDVQRDHGRQDPAEPAQRRSWRHRPRPRPKRCSRRADAKHVRLQLLLDLDVPPIVGDSDRCSRSSGTC